MTELYYHGFSEEERDEFEGYLKRLLNNLASFKEEDLV
jgi:hypothetical protein